MYVIYFTPPDKTVESFTYASDRDIAETYVAFYVFKNYAGIRLQHPDGKIERIN